MRYRGCIGLCVVGALLILATPATARFLPYSFAYNATLKDLEERTGSLVGADHHTGIDGCHRKRPGRIDCDVFAEGSEFVTGVNGSHYRHKRCTWTVVSHFRRGSQLVFYADRDTRCHTWISDSPVLRPGPQA